MRPGECTTLQVKGVLGLCALLKGLVPPAQIRLRLTTGDAESWIAVILREIEARTNGERLAPCPAVTDRRFLKHLSDRLRRELKIMSAIFD